ncbi:MAG: hypothetical protein ACRC68_17100, partial [Clostridium sp.]
MNEFNLNNSKCRSFNVMKNYTNLVSEIDCGSREEINNYTVDSIDELIKFVYENNEYYRNKLIEDGYNKAQKITFDIFEKIRFTTKDEL